MVELYFDLWKWLNTDTLQRLVYSNILRRNRPSLQAVRLSHSCTCAEGDFENKATFKKSLKIGFSINRIQIPISSWSLLWAPVVMDIKIAVSLLQRCLIVITCWRGRSSLGYHCCVQSINFKIVQNAPYNRINPEAVGAKCRFLWNCFNNSIAFYLMPLPTPHFSGPIDMFQLNKGWQL